MTLSDESKPDEAILTWVSDADGQRSMNAVWNSAVAGETKDASSLGNDWKLSVHPDDLAVVEEAFARGTREQRPFQIKYRLLRDQSRSDRDHVFDWVLDVGSPRFDRDHRFQGFTGQCFPLAEPTAGKLERRFALAVQGFEVGVWEVDRDRPEWMFTGHIEKMLGYDEGELKNMRSMARALVHEDDLPELDGVRLRHQMYNEPYAVDFRALNKSGEYQWLRSCGEAERLGGQVTRVAGTVANIDEIKKAQLSAAAEVKKRDEFLAMLSHELRNPMSAIIHGVFCGNELGPLPEPMREVWSVIDRQSDHMAKLLNDLLDVSRITANKIVFDRDTIDLAPLVHEIAELFEMTVRDKQLALEVIEVDSGCSIVGDSNRIRQAITNVIDNAIKCTPAGGSVKIRVNRKGENVVVSVRDSGKGIDEEDLAKIFELFYQGKRTLSREGGGLGVGLFLVNEILVEHQGSIVAKSDGPGQGSEFVLTIPSSEFSAQVSSDSDTLSAGSSIKSSKLMLVEDHYDSRVILSKLLTAKGFEVFAFPDGESALLEFGEINPGIAVIDIGLPGKDGFQLIQEIRQLKNGKDLLAIALTGYGQSFVQEATMSAGFDAHLTKPINSKTLTDFIANHLFEGQAQLP